MKHVFIDARRYRKNRHERMIPIAADLIDECQKCFGPFHHFPTMAEQEVDWDFSSKYMYYEDEARHLL